MAQGSERSSERVDHAAGPGAGASPHVPARRDLRILEAFRRIIRAIDLHSRKLATDYRITAPQLVALNVIAEGNPLSTSEIARRMHLSPSTVVGILDRLETKEVIVRQRSTKDRRLVLVELTDAGRQLIADAPSPLQGRLTEALATLPDAEQEVIAAALEKVVSLMEVREIDAAPILETGPILEEPGSSPKQGE